MNRKHGLKLKFRVGCFRPAAVDEHITFVHLGDGLDPAVAALGKPIKVVNLKGFLGHKVIIFNDGKASRTLSDVMPALLLWTQNPIERSRQANQPRLLVRHQRLRKVREEVVWVFDANREPDRRISDAHANAQLAGYARMRCAARMAG